MKRLVIAFFLLISTGSINSQEINKPSTNIKAVNTGFIEIGGVGGHYSLNYDRVLLETNIMNLSAGIGLSHGIIESDMKLTPRIPIRVNVFRSIMGNHNAELGVAYNPYYTAYNDLYHSIFANIGYRYQDPSGGLFIKAGFSPMIFNNAMKFIPWGAISVGYSF
jgi:hypothetical protein